MEISAALRALWLGKDFTFFSLCPKSNLAPLWVLLVCLSVCSVQVSNSKQHGNGSTSSLLNSAGYVGYVKNTPTGVHAVQDTVTITAEYTHAPF